MSSWRELDCSVTADVSYPFKKQTDSCYLKKIRVNGRRLNAGKSSSFVHIQTNFTLSPEPQAAKDLMEVREDPLWVVLRPSDMQDFLVLCEAVQAKFLWSSLVRISLQLWNRLCRRSTYICVRNTSFVGSGRSFEHWNYSTGESLYLFILTLHNKRETASLW